MNVALWIVQGLLGLVFLYAGAIKVFAYGYYATYLTKVGQTPVARGLAGLIGIAEMVGAIGVVVPMSIHVVPALSAWAAVGLGAIMLLAMGYHLRGREPATASVVLFLMATFVSVGRFSYGPCATASRFPRAPVAAIRRADVAVTSCRWRTDGRFSAEPGVRVLQRSTRNCWVTPYSVGVEEENVNV